MTAIFANVVVGAVILLQTTATLPVRIGELAKSWTDSEIVNIRNLVAPTGPAPWLLHGYHGTFTDVVEAYFSPDSANKDVRRGALVVLARSNGTLAGPVSTSWAVYQRTTYAQVAVAGRNFNQLEGDTDVNRPFQITGKIDDDELVRLVTVIRTKSVKPIRWIDRAADVSVAVHLFGDGVPNRITLRKSGSDWIVVSIEYEVA